MVRDDRCRSIVRECDEGKLFHSRYAVLGLARGPDHAPATPHPPSGVLPDGVYGAISALRQQRLVTRSCVCPARSSSPIRHSRVQRCDSSCAGPGNIHKQDATLILSDQSRAILRRAKRVATIKNKWPKFHPSLSDHLFGKSMRSLLTLVIERCLHVPRIPDGNIDRISEAYRSPHTNVTFCVYHYVGISENFAGCS